MFIESKDGNVNKDIEMKDETKKETNDEKQPSDVISDEKEKSTPPKELTDIEKEKVKKHKEINDGNIKTAAASAIAASAVKAKVDILLKKKFVV